MNIKVLYSCQGCGIVKRAVDVPAREKEDVKEWLETTMEFIGKDHERFSQNCHSQLADLYVPMNGTEKVGGIVIQ